MGANIKNQAIVIQMHIPEHDVQGNLSSDDKQAMLELSTQHLRLMNKNTHIILCGHGCVEPSKVTKEVCDNVIWETPGYPLDKRGCIIGQPAQFKSVYKGIEKAKELGFSRILKARGDSIIGIPNICNRLEKVLDDEGKELFVTQQTASKKFKLGDCWMYGDIDELCDIWNEENEVQCSVDGVVNTGMNWIKYHHRLIPNEISEFEWNKLIKYHCSFRDVYSLKIVDLRHNWSELKLKKRQILDNELDYKQYIWGTKNGWHLFDDNGVDQIMFDGTAYTMKTFYER